MSRPASAGLAAACAAAAFAGLARTLGLWTGDFASGAGLAVACAGAGLAAAFAFGAPSSAAAPWWSLAAALTGPVLAAWVKVAGLSAHQPELLTYGPAAPLGPLLPACALAFFLLGRAARASRARGPLDAAWAPAALLAAHAALGRLEAPLVLALATPALLLAAPRPGPAAASLALAAACAGSAAGAFRAVWTLRLDHLYAGWTWISPPAGEDARGAVRFPDGRAAVLRAGRLTFEDHATARLALAVVLGQAAAEPRGVLLAAPGGPTLLAAARAAGLEAAVRDRPPRTPPSARLDLLVARVPGRGGRADRARLVDLAALRAWRRGLTPEAPAGILFDSSAPAADVAAAAQDAAAAFGHAAVAELPGGVLVVASPRPVIADPGALAWRLPAPARLGWDPAVVLGTVVRWRPDAPRK